MSHDEFSRRLLDRQREFDAALHAALQVPAPDGLADRILVARGLAPARRRWIWPVAAGLVLAAGAAALWPRLAAREDPLAREAIAHVAHEPQSFTTAHAVPGDFLPAMLSNQGVSLARSVGQVTYARTCPMAGRVAHHLVVRTAQGPVTLFLLAEDPAARTRAVAERDGMAAVVVPAAKGSITIVASDLAQALALEKSLRT